MAFFDDLGKKISNAGQTVAQKTKDVTEIAKLNVSIADFEKKITKTYQDIGKLYVERHVNDIEEGFADLVAIVKQTEQEIDSYKKKISDIKGVVNCEKCGAEVGKNVAFCSACGNPMPKVEQPEVVDNMPKCVKCGAALLENSRFCTSCGCPVTEPVQQEEKAEVKENKKCPVCGLEVAEGNLFCTACGAKIQ